MRILKAKWENTHEDLVLDDLQINDVLSIKEINGEVFVYYSIDEEYFEEDNIKIILHAYGTGDSFNQYSLDELTNSSYSFVDTLVLNYGKKVLHVYKEFIYVDDSILDYKEKYDIFGEESDYNYPYNNAEHLNKMEKEIKEIMLALKGTKNDEDTSIEKDMFINKEDLIDKGKEIKDKTKEVSVDLVRKSIKTLTGILNYLDDEK